MKDGRPHGETKAVGAHRARATAVEHEIIGCEMDGAAKHAARHFGRGAGTDGTAPRVLETYCHYWTSPYATTANGSSPWAAGQASRMVGVRRGAVQRGRRSGGFKRKK